MGIFSGKSFNKTTGALEDKEKEYKNIAKQSGIKLPTSPKEEPKRGLLSKVGSVLAAFETAPAVEAAIKGENPFSAYVSSVKKGLSGNDDIASKTSYVNILEKNGWKSAPGTGSLRESATWKNFGKEILGLGLDIVLDPTTYLTAGLGKGAQLETKEGIKTLSKTGQKVLSSTAKKEAINVGEKLAQKGIQKTEQELAQAGLKTAQRTLARSTEKKLFDQGGIKFAGKTIIEGKTLSKPFEFSKNVLQKTDTGTKIVDSLSSLKNSLGKTFYRDYGLPEKYVKEKQIYLDKFKSDADDITTTLSNVFKGTTKQDRETISKAIESGDLSGLSDFNRNIAEKSKNIFDDIAKNESERGLLDNTLEDYVTHIYKDKEKAKQIISYMKEGPRGGATKFAKERVIPTIDEAEKLGLKPEKDIANILAARMMASQKAIREQELLRGVKKFGEPLKDVKSALDKDLVEYTNKEFKGLLIPRNIASDLEKLSKKTINNEEINKFLRGFDAVQNFFKGSVTTLFPAFHGRNFISNVAQNFLDTGVKALNPIDNMRAYNILSPKSKGVLTTENGIKYSYNQLRKTMKEKGIIGSPGAMDVTSTVEQNLAKGLSRIKKYTPSNIGRGVGSSIENHARTLNFLANVEKGLPLDQAAKRTKEFLFDYDNLSDFEKTIMKRAIPFYTWTRKNIELQGKTLLQRPGLIGAELKAQRIGKPETQKERQALPEYISEQLAIKTGVKNGMVNYLTGLGLPIENFLSNLPQGISKDEMVDYLNKIASQGSFLPKYIAELATGHEFFRNKPLKEIYNASEFAKFPQPIKDFLELKENKVDYVGKNGKRVKYTQYVANPYKLHLLRNIPTARITSTVGGILDENQSAIGRLLKYTTGIKIYPIDVEKMEDKEMKEYIKQIEEILTNYGKINTFKSTYVPKEKSSSIFK